MTDRARILTDPADLPAALEAARLHALAAGALLPIQVEGDTVIDGGVPFRVEWISTLAMKDLAALVPRAGDKAKDFNPFLPYDPDLLVAVVSDTHVAILNKFPVWRGHFLLITRAFVDQEAPLDLSDIEACAMALAGVEGFMFFNSGGVSGASQPHRHLQMIPAFPAPIAALLPADGPAWTPRRAPALPFSHVFCRLERDRLTPPRLFEAVQAACAAAGLAPDGGRLPPYNLLMTRDWLMVVPRRIESVEGLSLSGLGYAGHIGLRTPDQLALVRAHGPLRMLTEAAGGSDMR